MKQPLRIAHVPARTAYVWKLHSDAFTIVNGTKVRTCTVPHALSLRQILDRQLLDWMDIIHLHHIESEPLDDIEETLEMAAKTGTGIVLTVHDLEAMFNGNDDLAERYTLLAQPNIVWTTTSHGAARELMTRYTPPTGVHVTPLGYAIAPQILKGRTRSQNASSRRYFMYGAMRPNRDHLSSLANWSLGLPEPTAQFNLSLRALSPVDFERQKYRPSELMAIIQSDPRIQAHMKPYPTDSDLVDMAMDSDCLVLPYRWGSHSGQLEFAFDLGLLPLATSVGFLKEQRELHGDLVPEPVWFDWNHTNPYLQGEQFLEALYKADALLTDNFYQPNPRFLEYRMDEHSTLLSRHRELYELAVLRSEPK